MTTLVIGDSFCYGSELYDVDNVWWKHIWPDAHNVSKPGQGNQYITRQLCNWWNQADFVVIMWTFPNRYEFKFNVDTGRNDPWHTPGTLEEPKEIKKFHETFNKYVGTDKMYQMYTSWKEIMFAEMFLQREGIDYMFTHADWSIFDLTTLKTTYDKTKWFHPDEYDNKGFLNWAIDKGYERGPDGHPLDNAHRDFAEEVKK